MRGVCDLSCCALCVRYRCAGWSAGGCCLRLCAGAWCANPKKDGEDWEIMTYENDGSSTGLKDDNFNIGRQWRRFRGVRGAAM